MATLSGSGIENFRKVLSGDVTEMLPKADRSTDMASELEPLNVKESKNCAKNGLEEQNIKIFILLQKVKKYCSDRSPKGLLEFNPELMGILYHIVEFVTYYYETAMRFAQQK
jgi:hypothetical protein